MAPRRCSSTSSACRSRHYRSQVWRVGLPIVRRCMLRPRTHTVIRRHTIRPPIIRRAVGIIRFRHAIERCARPTRRQRRLLTAHHDSACLCRGRHVSATGERWLCPSSSGSCFGTGRTRAASLAPCPAVLAAFPPMIDSRPAADRRKSPILIPPHAITNSVFRLAARRTSLPEGFRNWNPRR